MARKKTAAKKPAANQMPKGFTAITKSSASWPNESTEVGDTLQGVVIEYDTVSVKRGRKVEDSQVLKLETADGSVYSIWESAVLRPLFEDDFTDVEIWLQYDGRGTAKKGQNAPKLFKIAYQEA